MPTPRISLIAPAHNEAENVQRLVEEVGRAGPGLARALGGEPGDFEFVLVDDGSTDDTRARALALQPERPWLRIIAMTRTPPGKGGGQSAAFHAGFRACRAPLVGVLDADLQNDPADLLAMLELLQRQNADMVQGDRSANRRDNLVRRVGSIVGRRFRAWILGDTIRDTGCSLRLLKREIAVQLPLEFRGMHRFIPVTARHLGYKVVEMPVSHRPRVAGETKYGMGVLTRALPGLIDCFAVRWMRTRRRPVESAEAGASGRPASVVEAAGGAGRQAPVIGSAHAEVTGGAAR
ncbi:MAG: glycosyltransferase family 2 protein [Planctomycetota bacterium]|nr:glycosyltransferase family 2 protein [Planctomycetota bacterium]